MVQKYQKNKNIKSVRKTPAWHSSVYGTEVYHNNRECTEGDNIKEKYYRSGEKGEDKNGNKKVLKICSHCERLNNPKISAH